MTSPDISFHIGKEDSQNRFYNWYKINISYKKSPNIEYNKYPANLVQVYLSKSIFLYKHKPFVNIDFNYVQK